MMRIRLLVLIFKRIEVKGKPQYCSPILVSNANMYYITAHAIDMMARNFGLNKE